MSFRARLSAAGVAPEDGEDDESAACGSGGSIWISSTVLRGFFICFHARFHFLR